MNPPKILAVMVLAAALAGCVTGCQTAPTPMTKAAVTQAVATGASFGLEQYPTAVPEVRIAESVICATAASTNIQPQQVVDAIAAAGVTNQYAKLIINGAISLYDVVFAAYGATWVQNQPALQGYLSAVCDGLVSALPPVGAATARRSVLPAHLK